MFGSNRGVYWVPYCTYTCVYCTYKVYLCMYYTADISVTDYVTNVSFVDDTDIINLVWRISAGQNLHNLLKFWWLVYQWKIKRNDDKCFMSFSHKYNNISASYLIKYYSTGEARSQILMTLPGPPWDPKDQMNMEKNIIINFKQFY